MKKPSKTQILKEMEDRLDGNLRAVAFTVKKLRDALSLLGHIRAAETLDISLCGALAMAQADALRLRRTRPSRSSDDSEEYVERLKAVDNAARVWRTAVEARRHDGPQPGGRLWKLHNETVQKAGRKLFMALDAAARQLR